MDPDDHDAQKDLAFDLLVLGWVYGTVDRLEDAVECLTRATNVFQLLVELTPGNPEPEVVKDTIQALTVLAEALRGLGRLDEVETATARAEELARMFPNPEPNEGD